METLLQQANGGAVKEENSMPKFLTIKDGFGYDVLVANLDHDCWAPRTGYIQIESLTRNKRHTKNIIIKNSNDKESGAVFGISLGVDRVSKGIRWEGITLHDVEFFDLSKRKERHRYIVLSRHSTMEGSPNLFGAPLFREINKEKKASNYLQERSEKKRCQEIADGLTYEQMIELAMAFGIDPKANSQVMLTAEILRIADTDHKKFLGVWDNPARKGMTTFKRAITNGLISFDAINGYTYQGHKLGQTEPAAFTYLTSNIQLLSTLDMLSKEKEDSSIHHSRPAVVEKVDALAEMQKEMARLMAENEALKAKKESAPDELTQLRAEAKELSIKGFALMGIDKLREEIEKAKQ
jgi:hypothetical protein